MARVVICVVTGVNIIKCLLYYLDKQIHIIFFFVIGPVANATDVPQPLRLIVLSYPPLFLDVPTSTARCPHARNDARDPSSEASKFR